MESMTLVIYHDGCPDGLTAAWVCLKALEGLEEVVCVGASYPNERKLLHLLKRYAPIPCSVFVVDFSFPRADVEEALAAGYGMVILDHHKTAKEDLDGLPPEVATFDMGRSGAELAWDYFYPHAPRPDLVRYVADRDLWRHQLPNTREINAFILSCNPQRPNDMWDIYEALEDPDQSFMSVGSALIEDYDRRVASLAKRFFEVTCGGVKGVAVFAPHFYASDLGHYLVQREGTAQFALVLDISPNAEGELMCRGSFRSEDHLADVSVMAKSLGGGGHRNAAGFTVPLEGRDLKVW